MWYWYLLAVVVVLLMVVEVVGGLFLFYKLVGENFRQGRENLEVPPMATESTMILGAIIIGAFVGLYFALQAVVSQTSLPQL